MLEAFRVARENVGSYSQVFTVYKSLSFLKGDGRNHWGYCASNTLGLSLILSIQHLPVMPVYAHELMSLCLYYTITVSCLVSARCALEPCRTRSKAFILLMFTTLQLLRITAITGRA